MPSSPSPGDDEAKSSRAVCPPGHSRSREGDVLPEEEADRSPLPSSVLLQWVGASGKTFSSCRNRGSARLPGTFALIKTSRTVPEGNFPGFGAEVACSLDARPAGKGVRMGGSCAGHQFSLLQPCRPWKACLVWKSDRGFVR